MLTCGSNVRQPLDTRFRALEIDPVFGSGLAMPQARCPKHVIAPFCPFAFGAGLLYSLSLRS